MAASVTVAVVDDHPVVIEGVRTWIGQDAAARVRIVSAGPDLDAAVHGAGRHADVILLDLELEGRLMIDAIVATAHDRPAVPPAMAGVMVADQRPRLAPQERTALLLWFQSRSKAAVAERMGIRETTVKQYIDRARIKYGQVGRHAAGKAALLARAIEDGLVRPDEIDDL